MKNILGSASKLVFLLFSFTICLSFVLGKLDVNNFVQLAGLPFAFYFANKGETTTRGPEAYAGK